LISQASISHLAAIVKSFDATLGGMLRRDVIDIYRSS